MNVTHGHYLGICDACGSLETRVLIDMRWETIVTERTGGEMKLAEKREFKKHIILCPKCVEELIVKLFTIPVDLPSEAVNA